MMFEKKLNMQFHAKRVFEFFAVVEQKRKTPVRVVERARAPLRPM